VQKPALAAVDGIRTGSQIRGSFRSYLAWLAIDAIYRERRVAPAGSCQSRLAPRKGRTSESPPARISS
jgi:hypothetical protein